jgi:hypothetical protein
MDLPDEIIAHEILSHIGWTELYDLRYRYPKVYSVRLKQPTELFLKFLTAIDHDDVDLFVRVWNQTHDYVAQPFILTGMMTHLVCNVMAAPGPSLICRPRQIMGLLLSTPGLRDLFSHLQNDYDLIVQLINNPDLIRDIVFYSLGLGAANRKEWINYSDATTTIRDIDSLSSNDIMINRDYLLTSLTTILIGGVISDYYPNLGEIVPTSAELRLKVIEYRSNILEMFSEPSRNFDLYERSKTFCNVASLGLCEGHALDFPTLTATKRFTTARARLWYEGLFDPEMYRHLIRIKDPDEWTLLFQVTEGTIIRPPCLIRAMLSPLHLLYEKDVRQDIIMAVLLKGMMGVGRPDRTEGDLRSKRVKRSNRAKIAPLITPTNRLTFWIPPDVKDATHVYDCISPKNRKIIAQQLLLWLDGKEGRLTDRIRDILEVHRDFLGVIAS